MVEIKVRLDNDDHYKGGNTKEYIVVHDTGNRTDSDEGNANYFCTGKRNASAHYFVDDDSITQVVLDDDCSFHCGDGNGKYGITNKNSIGIELCRVNNNTTEITKNNAIDLIRMLMNKYNIPIEKVVRHYDASRKMCPSSMSANNWAKWYEFKAKLSQPSQQTFPITMYAHVQNMGNLQESNDNQCGIGTVDKSLRLEGICLNVEGVEFEYFAHIQYIGDTPKMSKGCYLGTMGMARRIEGFQIDVTSIPSGYKLQYRGNIQFKGMTDWIDSGNFLGTRGEDLRLEYIEVRVIKA